MSSHRDESRKVTPKTVAGFLLIGAIVLAGEFIFRFIMRA